MAKRKKIFGKVNLFETSVVGIGSYPDAHLSLDDASFSLVKALTLADVPGTGVYKDELNLENEVMEEEVVETPTEVAEVETTDEPKAEEANESSVEETVEEEASAEETTEEAEKSVEVVLAKAIDKLAKELATKRGLVAKEEEDPEVALKKKLDGMSLGELACMQKDSLGRPLFGNW